MTRTPFRGSVARREGRVSRARLYGPSFVKVLPDTYVGADAVKDAAVWAQALAVWAPEAVVAGSLAAMVLGVDAVDERPEIVVPRRRRSAGDVLVRLEHLLPGEVVTVDRLRVTSPARTAFDLARRLEYVDAVAMADALGRRRRVRPADLQGLVGAHPDVRHLERVRRVIPAMDPLAESLMETRTRLALIERGVPRPVLQVRVQTRRRVYRLDMAWPSRRVAVEYDGRGHRTREQQEWDAIRDAELGEVGWRVIWVVGGQLEHEPDDMARRVLSALGL